MAARIAGPETRAVRLLAYNTWLISAPPTLDRRGRLPEIGRALNASGVDIFALCEVFSKADGDNIERQLSFSKDSRRGPRRVGPLISSGLHTIVRRSAGRILRSNRVPYITTGGTPDAFARKGVLHVEIDLGPGRVDLFLTHMYAPGARQGSGRSPVRERQTVELLQFVRRVRRPENVVIVVGDLNVDARKREYERLLSMMGSAGLHDAWLTRGSRLGATAAIQDFGAICGLDGTGTYCRDFPRSDDPTTGTLSDRIPGYRLDYIFIERPTGRHAMHVDLGRVRRRPFWRGEPHSPMKFKHARRPHFLSDHLGLEVTLFVSPSGGAT